MMFSNSLLPRSNFHENPNYGGGGNDISQTEAVATNGALTASWVEKFRVGRVLTLACLGLSQDPMDCMGVPHMAPLLARVDNVGGVSGSVSTVVGMVIAGASISMPIVSCGVFASPRTIATPMGLPETQSYPLSLTHHLKQ
ncbi:hypothetical protein Salat_2721400 [Sesamum alatum]|uniref:Uncharacterized protein n=1 Tax=Sesamum alatum TaxID=300844 RepID=A0AAE1XQF4_9LAMI|nr:hypothetical protein Salat_2721400 [Sesamum alatum]